MIKRVVHLDDNEECRRIVRNALVSLRDVELAQFDSLYGFISGKRAMADLYVTDRHYSKKTGYAPDDEAWRYFIECVKGFNYQRDVPIIMLTNSPPADSIWRPAGIKLVLSKKDFNPVIFREIIEGFLNYHRREK